MSGNRSLEILHEANARFSQYFARFSGVPVSGTEEEVLALRGVEAVLRRVAPLLDGRLNRNEQPDVRAEIELYRQNLLRLKSELAVMQVSASSSRDRLLSRERHLTAVKAWCAASRSTQNGES